MEKHLNHNLDDITLDGMKNGHVKSIPPQFLGEKNQH